MSSPDRRLGRLALVPVLALPLGGCLQPLYGAYSPNAGIKDELQAIAVDPIPERIGHYLGDELVFDLNGTGSHVPPRYRLHVAVAEQTQTPLIDTTSGRASAGTVVITADYVLTSATAPQPIAKGSVSVAADYDRTSQRFANVRAARDAEIRDAKRLADLIQTRIAAVFAGQGRS